RRAVRLAGSGGALKPEPAARTRPARVDPDRPVDARVQRTRFAVAAARASGAALVGGGALVLCLAGLAASATESSRASPGPEGWAVAAAAALLAAASWWLEQRPRAAAIARRIDDVLRFDGALVTAFEAEGRAHPSELARALSRRVAARLPLREALR